MQLVLATCRAKILENTAVSKTYKMRTFGTSHVKHFVALFNWQGPKGEEDEDKKKEDNLEVKTSLMAFLRTLLTSSRHGVVFQDVEYGCEKGLNPLLTVLLSKLVKPWENPDLARITSEILSTSPAEIPHFLTKLRPDWKPRMSGVWLQIMDLLYLTFTNIDIKYMVETFKNTNKVGIHILQSILLPLHLVDEVLLPALVSEHPPVARHALDLLDLVLRNAEQFIKLANKQPVEKEFRFLLKDRLPSADILTNIWDRELRTPELGHIPKVLSLISFNTRYASGGGMVDILQILKDLETLENTKQMSAAAAQPHIGPAVMDPRLQTLQIITDLLATDQHLATFLTRYVSEDLLRMLLTSGTSSSAKEQTEARSILATIAKQTGICLEGEDDLDLLLDLAPPASARADAEDATNTNEPSNTVMPAVAAMLHTAVHNQAEFQAEIYTIQMNMSQDEAHTLLDSWANADFEEDPKARVCILIIMGVDRCWGKKEN